VLLQKCAVDANIAIQEYETLPVDARPQGSQLLRQGGHPTSEARDKVRNIEDSHVLGMAPADIGVDVLPNRYRVVGKDIHLALSMVVLEQP
jgi:hypothetical protein